MKKSRILFAVFILLFTVAASSGCARWWHRHYTAESAVKRIDGFVDKLDLKLTDEQKVKLDAVKAKTADFINSWKDSRVKMLNLFNEEAKKEVPDFSALLKTYKEVNSKRKDGIDELADRFNEFYLSLDNAQKKKVVDALKVEAAKYEKWVK